MVKGETTITRCINIVCLSDLSSCAYYICIAIIFRLQFGLKEQLHSLTGCGRMAGTKNVEEYGGTCATQCNSRTRSQ